MQVKSMYADHLRPSDSVLDLGCSYDSHLPDNLTLSNLTGLGINEAELEANTSLTRFGIATLNLHTRTLVAGDIAVSVKI